MSILSNYIIQDLIQNVSKGVTETFKFVLEKYNSNESASEGPSTITSTIFRRAIYMHQLS